MLLYIIIIINIRKNIYILLCDATLQLIYYFLFIIIKELLL